MLNGQSRDSPALTEVLFLQPWTISQNSRLRKQREFVMSLPSACFTYWLTSHFFVKGKKCLSLNLVLGHMRGWVSCLLPWNWVSPKAIVNAIRKGQPTSQLCYCCNTNSQPRIPYSGKTYRWTQLLMRGSSRTTDRTRLLLTFPHVVLYSS
jgi:hypothetical protein